MTILAIDWGNKHSDFLSKVEKEGHKIILETEDGGRAYKLAGDHLPQLILFMGGKAAHSIQTAKSIRERKKTADAQMVFITSDEVEKTKFSELGTVKSEEEFFLSL